MRINLKYQLIQTVSMLLAVAFVGLAPAHANGKAGLTTTPVTAPARMTVSLQVLGDNKRTLEVNREDLIVKQNNKRVEVTGWTAARGDRAGLDLFILIDEASNPSLGSKLGDLRDFINAQPSSTSVGVGYMHNGTVQIAQNFTTEHAQAAKAVRLPSASRGAFGSPYLSVIDLMKRWPADSNRREVVMITDGIDRFRSGARYFSYISPDVSSASAVAQRTGTMIHTIFTRGVGRLANNFWEINNGQNGIAKLSDETGGESYYLGTENPVSFKPYLDDLQKTLNNQFLLEFNAQPNKKAGLQYIKLSTEVAGVDFNSADGAWVAAQ